jgi:hypothetical protein
VIFGAGVAGVFAAGGAAGGVTVAVAGFAIGAGVGGLVWARGVHLSGTAQKGHVVPCGSARSVASGRGFLQPGQGLAVTAWLPWA